MRRDNPWIILIDDEMFVVRFDGLTKSSCVARNIPPHRACSTQMVLLPCQIFWSDQNPIIEAAWKLPPANFYCFKLSSWNRINTFSISGHVNFDCCKAYDYAREQHRLLSILTSWVKEGSMVILLDGNLEIDANVRSNLCYLICLRH